MELLFWKVFCSILVTAQPSTTAGIITFAEFPVYLVMVAYFPEIVYSKSSVDTCASVVVGEELSVVAVVPALVLGVVVVVFAVGGTVVALEGLVVDETTASVVSSFPKMVSQKFFFSVSSSSFLEGRGGHKNEFRNTLGLSYSTSF